MSCLDNLVGMVIGGTKSRTQEYYYELNVVRTCMCMLFASRHSKQDYCCCYVHRHHWRDLPCVVPMLYSPAGD
jgi:hypothetical protein